MRTELTSKYRIEERYRSQSGWHVHRVHDHDNKALAWAAFDGMVAEQAGWDWSRDWRLVLLGPDRVGGA